jgi:SAM-dependent methyltransferase
MKIKNFFHIRRWLPKVGFIESRRTRIQIQYKIQSLKKQQKPVNVNLGCGGHYHPLWINLDFIGDGVKVLPWDLREGFPFPDGSCHAIYSSHVLEHLDRKTVHLFLSECQRVLKIGGVLRLALPDLEAIVRSYLYCLEEARKNIPGSEGRYEWSVIELIDQLVRHESGGEMLTYWKQECIPEQAFVAQRVGDEFWRFRAGYKPAELSSPQKQKVSTFLDVISVGRFRLGGEVHRWMYDSYSIARMLQRIGFKNIETCSAINSRISNFMDFKLDTDIDGKPLKPDSFFIEAVRG